MHRHHEKSKTHISPYDSARIAVPRLLPLLDSIVLPAQSVVKGRNTL
jgi:hypothetical protein